MPWAQVGYPGPPAALREYSSFPESSCRRAFAQVVPSSLSTFASISICIYPIHFQNLSQCHYLQRALFFFSSHCSQPFHRTAKARCVHLINTLVTHSVAAQLLVSKSGAPPAGEIFQGRAVILLSPGLGTAVPPPQSQCRPSKGAFSLQSL